MSRISNRPLRNTLGAYSHWLDEQKSGQGNVGSRDQLRAAFALIQRRARVSFLDSAPEGGLAICAESNDGFLVRIELSAEEARRLALKLLELAP